MVFRPNTSWISRGFFATGALMAFGLLHILFLNAGVDTPLSMAVAWIAGFSAFVVMIYDGIVMTYSPSLPLWNNSLLPVLRVSYALMGGVTLTLLLSAMPGLAGLLAASRLQVLENLERWLIIANLVMVVIYIMTMTYSVTTAKESAYLIVKKKYPAVFWGGLFLLDWW